MLLIDNGVPLLLSLKFVRVFFSVAGVVVNNFVGVLQCQLYGEHGWKVNASVHNDIQVLLSCLYVYVFNVLSFNELRNDMIQDTIR